MPHISSDDLIAFAAGALMGVIGFLPLLTAVLAGRRGRHRRSVAQGLVAVAISFAFLMAVEASTWIFAPAEILAVTVGMLVGFFAMWALLAFLALTHRC